MSETILGIRHKRYKLCEKVYLTITPTIGHEIVGVIDNCSIYGIGVTIEKKKASLDWESEVNNIIPASSIKWGDKEYNLGRIVLRYFLQSDPNKVYAGFSVIDYKVPISGFLSAIIDRPLSKNDCLDIEVNKEKCRVASFTQINFSNVDIFDRCRKFELFYKEWKKTPQYLYEEIRMPSKDVRINLSRNRKKNRNDYISMGSNDYYGLAFNEEVVDAAKNAMDLYGFGSTGSPLTTGLTKYHEELTDYISSLFNKEAALLYNSGYSVNLGVLQGLANAQDLFIADKLCHASIYDGMNLSQATYRVFKHNNTDHLEDILTNIRKKYVGTMVISEGIFSMDGDVTPIDKIVAVAKKHKCRTFIDEAHSFGVLGKNGLGVCEKYSVLDDVDLIMGTFSKVCGSIGGFIASNREVINWLRWYCRAHMFSVSIPPSTAAATLKALKIFNEDKSYLHKLKENIYHFCNGLRDIGYNIAEDHESSVCPVIIGDEKKLGEMNKIFLEEGIFVTPIIYPAVKSEDCRFRFTIMASHSLSDLDYVINVLRETMLKTNFTFK